MSTDPNDLQVYLCSHLLVTQWLSPAPLWGLSTCVLTQHIRTNVRPGSDLTQNALVCFSPWFIFLAQQDLEKSHSLCKWSPKHWKLPPLPGPSTGCLHVCGMGVIDKIIPPQSWCCSCVPYACFFFSCCWFVVLLGFLSFFVFFKEIPEWTKEKKFPIWLWRQNWACGGLSPNFRDLISFWFAAFLILPGKTNVP